MGKEGGGGGDGSPAASVKEMQAMIFNIKEQRLLARRISTLSLEQNYAMKLISLGNRQVKLGHRRLKSKVSRIHSHLSADQILAIKALGEHDPYGTKPIRSTSNHSTLTDRSRGAASLLPRRKANSARGQSSPPSNQGGLDASRPASVDPQAAYSRRLIGSDRLNVGDVGEENVINGQINNSTNIIQQDGRQGLGSRGAGDIGNRAKSPCAYQKSADSANQPHPKSSLQSNVINSRIDEEASVPLQGSSRDSPLKQILNTSNGSQAQSPRTKDRASPLKVQPNGMNRPDSRANNQNNQSLSLANSSSPSIRINNIGTQNRSHNDSKNNTKPHNDLNQRSKGHVSRCTSQTGRSSTLPPVSPRQYKQQSLSLSDDGAPTASKSSSQPRGNLLNPRASLTQTTAPALMALRGGGGGSSRPVTSCAAAAAAAAAAATPLPVTGRSSRPRTSLGFSSHDSATRDAAAEAGAGERRLSDLSDSDVLNVVLKEQARERRREILDEHRKYSATVEQRKNAFVERITKWVEENPAVVTPLPPPPSADPAGGGTPGTTGRTGRKRLINGSVVFVEEEDLSALTAEERAARERDIWQELTKCRYLRISDDVVDLSGVNTLARDQLMMHNTFRIGGGVGGGGQ